MFGDEVKGFGVRCTSGAGTYVVEVRDNGHDAGNRGT